MTVEEWDRTAFVEIRALLPTACIGICWSSKQKPTPENLKQARQTLYQWARDRYTDWKDVDSLLHCLRSVVAAATVLGLPLTYWENGRVGNTRWPRVRWPEKEGGIRIWNRLAIEHSQRLWDWYRHESA